MNACDAIVDAPVASPRSSAFDLTSTANGVRYRVRFAWPDEHPPAAGWPVVWVLDGDAYFGFVADAVRNRSGIGHEIAPAIVAAIGYAADDRAWHEHRARDYTPVAPSSASLPPAFAGGLHGGIEHFLDTIEHDIAPALSARLAIDRSASAIWGHSLGGLAVLYALFTRPDAYRSYLAVSPSIWFGERIVLAHEADFVDRLRRGRWSPRVHIAMGAREDEPPHRLAPGATSTLDEIATHVRNARMLDNARALVARLAACHGGPGYAVRYCELDHETHVSVPYAALRPALDLALPIDDAGHDETGSAPHRATEPV